MGLYDICYGNGMLVSVASSAVMTSGVMNSNLSSKEEGIKSAQLVISMGSTPVDTNVLSEKAVADSVPIISTGTSAPGTTPTKVGDIFVDTSGGTIYMSKGTSSSADWLQVNN